MYGILIVDDELPIVNGLAYDVPWGELGITEVLKATDDAGVLKCLDRYKIDVVITDIRMPGMDGLELAEVVRRRWPHVRIILLSGYNEFDYAQRAIDIDVFSYVVKPVRNEEIYGIVSRALSGIEKELESAAREDAVKKRLQDAVPVARERYLNAWVAQGRMDYGEAAGRIRAFDPGFSLYEKSFLILVRMDRWEDPEAGSASGLSEFALQRMICETLFKAGRSYAFSDPEGDCVAVGGAEDAEGTERMHAYAKGMAELFQMAAKRGLGCVVSIYWSGVCPTGNLQREYARMKSLARGGFLASPGVLQGPAAPPEPGCEESMHRLFAYPSFSSLLEARRADEALEKLESAFQPDGCACKPDTDRMLAACSGVYYAAAAEIVKDAIRSGMDPGHWIKELYLADDAGSPDELKSRCIGAARAYLGQARKLGKCRLNGVIDDIKEYMRIHIGENIGVTDVAASFYMHPNYLTRLFKQETGMSAIDCLIRLRIDRAKELLRDPQVKIYEVAERVGYDSIAHFSRIFKRETGLSPKEYQCRPAM